VTETTETTADASREQAGEAPRQAVTFENTRSIRTPADAQISPDGRRVAFTLAEWVADQPRARERIWVVEVGRGEPRPLTFGPKGDSSPRWSSDGATLAFVSERGEEDKGKAQLYVVPAEGGEARRVCVMPNGAGQPEWSPDGSRIAFLSHEGEEWTSGPKVNEELRHTRLWTVRPESDTPEPVTPPDATVWRYTWSPDGSQLAVYYSEGPGETDWYRGQIGLVPAGGGAIRRMTALTRQADAPAWSRDGRMLYFILGEWSDRGIVGGEVCALDVATGDLRNLTPGVEISVSWVRELPDGRLLYAAWDGLSNQVGTLDPRTGELQPVTRDFYLGDGAWPRLTATAYGRRLAATHGDEALPVEVWLGELSGTGEGERAEWRRLTRLNRLAEETLAIVPSRRVEYEGADGWRIQGLFTPPATETRDTPPPLVVLVHGGPTSAVRETYIQTNTIIEPIVQLLAAAGFAVLRTNPRGSIGRGAAFADAVLGDPGGKDFEDILRGADYVIGQGWADGARQGIFGWSYGGFMTAWAVTQTTRFKAAVMGAGVSDFHSFHAQSNIPDWDMRALAADPLARPDVYRERSAITFAGRIQTPTLVLHGEADESVPVNQSYAFYRALRERGVPAELAIYPGEGHGVRGRGHLRDLCERLVRWFESYLG
jgi:dipeptidyl aminopeptidase/acylaminoacyl peptidase